jgi:hypothetical protein
MSKCETAEISTLYGGNESKSAFKCEDSQPRYVFFMSTRLVKEVLISNFGCQVMFLSKTHKEIHKTWLHQDFLPLLKSIDLLQQLLASSPQTLLGAKPKGWSGRAAII